MSIVAARCRFYRAVEVAAGGSASRKPKLEDVYNPLALLPAATSTNAAAYVIRSKLASGDKVAEGEKRQYK